MAITQAYTIKRGDTLTAIAKIKSTSVEQILSLNPQITNRDEIAEGAILQLPGPQSLLQPPTPKVPIAPTITPTVPVVPTVPGTPTADAGLPPSQQVTPTPPPIAEVLDDAASAANQKAEDIFESIKDKDIDIRDSAEIIEEIEEEKEKIPEPTSLAELFETKRKELGLDVLEEELTGLDVEMETIRTTALIAAQKIAGEPIPAGAIAGRRGEITREAEQTLALLSVQRSALARRVTNKLNTLKLIVDISDKDYDNASDFYQKEFDNSIRLYNIVNDREEDEKNHVEKATDDARANLTVIHKQFIDAGIKYDDLTTDQKSKIAKMEVEAGFPTGFIALIMSEDLGGTIKTTKYGVDSQGNAFFDVLIIAPDGKMSVKSVPIGKRVSTSEIADPVLAQALRDSISAITDGADEDEIKRRFLETYPTKGSLYDEYHF